MKTRLIQSYRDLLGRYAGRFVSPKVKGSHCQDILLISPKYVQ